MNRADVIPLELQDLAALAVDALVSAGSWTEGCYARMLPGIGDALCAFQEAAKALETAATVAQEPFGSVLVKR